MNAFSLAAPRLHAPWMVLMSLALGLSSGHSQGPVTKPVEPMPLECGHLDLRFIYANGTWQVVLAMDDRPIVLPEFPVEDYPAILPSEAVIVASDRAFPKGGRFTRPSGSRWDFIGVEPGETFWGFPQTNQTCMWPGFAVDGAFANYFENDPRINASDKWVKFQLREVFYTGEGTDPVFSTWTFQNQLIRWMSTADGIDENDCFFVGSEAHAHLAWGFSERGIYEVDIEALAYSNAGTPISSGTHRFTFAVGSYAQWLSHHFLNHHFFGGLITDPEMDPDGDGLINALEYAFDLDPRSREVRLADPLEEVPGLPVTRPEGLFFMRRAAEANPQIDYLIETSADLEEWQSVDPTHVASYDEDWDKVRVARENLSSFARVRVIFKP